MYFGDFITNFGDGYRSKWKKEDFCKELLCSIVKNEDVVRYEKGKTSKKNERSDSTFQSYYRNHDRRFSKNMAIAMVNNIDTDKFKNFLIDYTSNCCSKAILSENFKKDIPDINEDNLFEKLTEKYIEILRCESNKPDKRRKESITEDPIKPSDIKLIESGSSPLSSADSLINEISQTVDRLFSLGSEIAIARYEDGGKDDPVSVAFRTLNLTDHFTNPYIQRKTKEQNELYEKLVSLTDNITQLLSETDDERLRKIKNILIGIPIEAFQDFNFQGCLIESKVNHKALELKTYLQSIIK